jgi:hypothetical protein
MDFVYYIVRKQDMVIIDGAADMVNAINIAQNQGCACFVLQGCVITEMGQDEDLEKSNESETVKPEIVESEEPDLA